MPESPENEAAPPAYEELLDQDKSKTDLDKNKPGHMFAKPLKSIMKSSKDKMKMNRKDSDARKKDSPRDVTDAHSPRQSSYSLATSQSLNLSQSMNNGAVDLDNITVSVVRSSSRSKVDQIELRSTSGLEKRSMSGALEPESGHHRRTSSFPEGGFSSSPPINDYAGPSNGEASKPLLSGITSAQSAINGANDSDDESVGFSTQL